jgi:Raf kinase inhibitor-like YbhB/YbcL family protein
MNVTLRVAVPGLLAAIAVACAGAGCDDSPGTGGAGGASSSTGAAMTTSSSADTTSSSVSTGSSMEMFALTSSTITEGMTFPDKYTCAVANQVSPPLQWTAGPEGTKSYAIVFTDLTFNNFKHAAIYDIPAAVMALPEGVQEAYEPTIPAGAKQTKSYAGNFGYAGPCPPETHTYEFKIYALDVASLPGLSMTSTIKNVEDAAKMHGLGTATLSGKGDPP